MALPNSTLNKGVDAMTPDLKYVSLHTAIPPTAGNEGAGVTRVPLTFPAASSAVSQSAQVALPDTPVGEYPSFGVWSAASGGTFIDGAALAAKEVVTAVRAVNLIVSLTGS